MRNQHWAVSLVMFLVSCGGSTSPTAAPSPTPAATPTPAFPGPQSLALVAALRTGGASAQVVEVMRSESFIFFTVPAVRIMVEGENVYAFEYTSATEADVAALQISPGGFEIATTHVDWISDPHFYRSDRMIVLYVGRTTSMLRLLQQLLGSQIAGKP